MSSLYSTINKGFKYNIRSLNFCCPAIVVGVDDISDGFIDVQPVLNKFYNDGTFEERAVLFQVPIMFASTQTTSITTPVNLGDGVLLIFTEDDPSDYILGVKEPHDPPTTSYLEPSHAVALIGYNPFQESPCNTRNYKNPIDNTSVNIVHNKNTDNEVKFSINQDGSLSVIAPKGVDYKTTKFSIDCEEFELNASTKASTRSPLISQNGK